jgi:hypothetical protein
MSAFLVGVDKNAIPIASPCNADWRTMTPADGGRFCGECKKVVRNLSAMSEKEARALLARPRNQELCIRYLHDKHGNVFFAGDGNKLMSASMLHRAKRTLVIAAAAAFPLGCSSGSLDAQGSGPSTHDTASDDPEMTENMGGATAYNPPELSDAGVTDSSRSDAADDAGLSVEAGGDAAMPADGGEADGGGADGAGEGGPRT